jgi:hypothetical protein
MALRGAGTRRTASGDPEESIKVDVMDTRSGRSGGHKLKGPLECKRHNDSSYSSDSTAYIYGPCHLRACLQEFQEKRCRRQASERIGVVATRGGGVGCTDLPAADLPPSYLANAAHVSILMCSAPPSLPPPLPAQTTRILTTEVYSSYLTHALRSHDPRIVAGI